MFNLTDVKNHFVENKKVYIALGVGVAVGVVLRSRPQLIQNVTGEGNVVNLIHKAKNVEVVVNYLNVRGYVAKAVRCIETGIEYASQVEAAEAIGATATNFSLHMTGRYPHINGLHFERVLEMA